MTRRMHDLRQARSNRIHAGVLDEQQRKYEELSFFTALLLAVSEHRAKSLEVMEDFIADLKRASNG